MSGHGGGSVFWDMVKKILLILICVIIFAILLALFIRHAPPLQNSPSGTEATSSY